MKIRYVYTVIREDEIEDKLLPEWIEYLSSMRDEVGEFLYGGTGTKETIHVHLEVFRNNKWEVLDETET